MTVGGKALHDKCVSLAICVIVLFSRTDMCGSLWFCPVEAQCGCFLTKGAEEPGHMWISSPGPSPLGSWWSLWLWREFNNTSSWEHVTHCSTEKDFCFGNALFYRSCNFFKMSCCLVENRSRELQHTNSSFIIFVLKESPGYAAVAALNLWMRFDIIN